MQWSFYGFFHDRSFTCVPLLILLGEGVMWQGQGDSDAREQCAGFSFLLIFGFHRLQICWLIGMILIIVLLCTKVVLLFLHLIFLLPISHYWMLILSLNINCSLLRAQLLYVVIFMVSSMILLSSSGLVGRYTLKSFCPCCANIYFCSVDLICSWQFHSSRFICLSMFAVSGYKLFVHGRLCWSRILLCGDCDGQLVLCVKLIMWNASHHVIFLTISNHTILSCVAFWVWFVSVMRRGFDPKLTPPTYWRFKAKNQKNLISFFLYS